LTPRPTNLTEQPPQWARSRKTLEVCNDGALRLMSPRDRDRQFFGRTIQGRVKPGSDGRMTSHCLYAADLSDPRSAPISKRSTAEGVLPILSAASQMPFLRKYQTWQNRVLERDVSHVFSLMLFGSKSGRCGKPSGQEPNRLRSPGRHPGGRT